MVRRPRRAGLAAPYAGGVEAKLSEAFAHARDVPDKAAVPRDFHAYELSPDDLA